MGPTKRSRDDWGAAPMTIRMMGWGSRWARFQSRVISDLAMKRGRVGVVGGGGGGKKTLKPEITKQSPGGGRSSFPTQRLVNLS